MKHRSLLLLAAALCPAAAWAHPGHGDHDFGWDFVDSGLHLLLDHGHWVLGAVVVGFIAYSLRSHRRQN